MQLFAYAFNARKHAASATSRALPNLLEGIFDKASSLAFGVMANDGKEMYISNGATSSIMERHERRQAKSSRTLLDKVEWSS